MIVGLEWMEKTKWNIYPPEVQPHCSNGADFFPVSLRKCDLWGALTVQEDNQLDTGKVTITI